MGTGSQKSSGGPVLYGPDGKRIAAGTPFVRRTDGRFVLAQGAESGMPTYLTDVNPADNYDPSRPMGPGNEGHAASGPTDSGMGHRDAVRATGSFVSPEDRLAEADRIQKQSILDHSPHSDPGPHDVDGFSFNDALRKEMVRRYLEAAAKNKPKHHDPTLDEQFNKLYGDGGVGDITAAYKAQEGAINAQYDQLLGRLNTEHGAAEKGVRAEGAQLQTALTAIGADATAQLTASNKQIDKDYGAALKGLNNDYKPLGNDLAKSGAGGKGLKAEAAQGRADLREAHSADSALGARYQQMLGQEINNRQATGATVTTANVDDLTRILQQSRDTASTDRLQAVAKVEASLAGDLAQAKQSKANAKYSFFLDVLKGGGTLGAAAVKVASPGVLKSAQDVVDGAQPDWNEPFKGVLKSKDKNEANDGIDYMQRISTGKISADKALLEWMSNPDHENEPLVTWALTQAVAYQKKLPKKAPTLQDVLGATGYTLNTPTK